MLGLLAAMAATAWMTALGLLAALVLEAALGLATGLGLAPARPHGGFFYVTDASRVTCA